MRPLQEMPEWFKRRRSLTELESRDGDLDSLWPDDPRLLFVRDTLGGIISKAVGCPDGRFIPTDSFSAIYNNFRTFFGYDSLDDAELLMDIEDAFAIVLPESNQADFDFSTISYLEFVRYIAEHTALNLDSRN